MILVDISMVSNIRYLVVDSFKTEPVEVFATGCLAFYLDILVSLFLLNLYSSFLNTTKAVQLIYDILLEILYRFIARHTVFDFLNHLILSFNPKVIWILAIKRKLTILEVLGQFSWKLRFIWFLLLLADYLFGSNRGFLMFDHWSFGFDNTLVFDLGSQICNFMSLLSDCLVPPVWLNAIRRIWAVAWVWRTRQWRWYLRASSLSWHTRELGLLMLVRVSRLLLDFLTSYIVSTLVCVAFWIIFRHYHTDNVELFTFVRTYHTRILLSLTILLLFYLSFNLHFLSSFKRTSYDHFLPLFN